MAAILIVVLSGIFLVFLLNFVLLELDIENHLYVNAVISSQSVSGPSRFYGCWLAIQVQLLFRFRNL